MMLTLKRAALLASALAQSTQAGPINVLATGASGEIAYSVGNLTYYSPGDTLAEGCPGFGTFDSLPLTVLETNETTVTAKVLEAIVDKYSGDDVWTESFLGDALAVLAPVEAELDGSAVAWIKDLGISYVLLNNGTDTTALKSADMGLFLIPSTWDLNPGPYLLSLTPSSITIRETYRLYRDSLEAFLFGNTPVPKSSAYSAVNLFLGKYQDAWIPVPSRLYSLKDGRPLAGLRVALKDIYDLEGVQTGGGSRSYAEVYPVASATAVSMQKLIDLGAVVIVSPLSTCLYNNLQPLLTDEEQGKTKTSQFAHGADPWQFIDIHYPWNPRGDGYLTAASSSSGSAAAIAGYPWLDIAIGSDTRGSVRKPAALVGSYGMRPTWKSMGLEGVIPLATEMDSAGFFARDPELFYQISKLWFDDAPVEVNRSFSSLPTRLVYPVDYFPLNNSAAQAIFDSFISTLKEEFGMELVPVNFTETLNDKVSDARITNITAFQLSSNRLAEYVSYNQVGAPLTEAWNSAFPGAGSPPLDPNPRNAFLRSESLTEEDYDEAVTIKNTFRDFWLENMLRPDNETCSDGIMILDMGTGGLPSYREQALNSMPGATSLSYTAPGSGPLIPSNYLASMSGSPQICIPFGQVSYESYISRQEEMLPVNVDLMAAPGCDGLLLEILKRLTERGLISEVKTGRRAF